MRGVDNDIGDDSVGPRRVSAGPRDPSVAGSRERVDPPEEQDLDDSCRRAATADPRLLGVTALRLFFTVASTPSGDALGGR